MSFTDAFPLYPLWNIHFFAKTPNKAADALFQGEYSDEELNRKWVLILRVPCYIIALSRVLDKSEFDEVHCMKVLKCYKIVTHQL